MAIVEYNSTIIKEMHTWLRHALSTNLAVKLLESLIVLIIALIFLRIVKSLLANLEHRNVISTVLSEQIYRLTAISVYSVTLIVITYIITSVSLLLYFVLALLIIILIANWNIIADIAAYYLLIAFRNVYQASLIELPRLGIRGRIVGSTLFHTRIRTPSGKIVYIPNHVMITEPIIQSIAAQSTIKLELNIDLIPLEQKQAMTDLIENNIRQALRETRLITRLQDVIIQVKGIQSNKMNLTLYVPVAGSEPRPNTINNIVAALYRKLKDLNPEIRVAYEPPPPI